MRIATLRTIRLPVQLHRFFYRGLAKVEATQGEVCGLGVVIQTVESHHLCVGGRHMQQHTLDKLIQGQGHRRL